MSEQATIEPTTEPDAPAIAEDAKVRLYHYSAWVHVGPGADSCEDIDEEAGTNDCSSPLHFHAWCRLPNQFQHRELREKGLAAKARRTRQLRDPESDANAILEDELDRIARMGEDAKGFIVDEILQKTWWKDYSEATLDVKTTEGEGEDEGPYEHIEDDQERYMTLEAMEPDERPADEYESLMRHLNVYNAAVDKRVEEIVLPQRKALEDLDINALLDRVRDDRIEATAMESFMHIYNSHQWAVCTLRSRADPKPIFPNVQAMESAAPETIEAIKEVFTDLEAEHNQGRLGKAS